jgi:hypothetical protein
MAMRRCCWLAGCLLAALIGCGPAPTNSAATGAEEVLRTYYSALLRQDWQRAYAALEADSRKRISSDAFTRLAQTHRKSLGFEPKDVHVRSCEEHGSEAIAHVLLVGQTANKQRSYKDAVTLRRGESGWAIVLPPHFGKPK